MTPLSGATGVGMMLALLAPLMGCTTSRATPIEPPAVEEADTFFLRPIRPHLAGSRDHTPDCPCGLTAPLDKKWTGMGAPPTDPNELPSFLTR